MSLWQKLRKGLFETILPGKRAGGSGYQARRGAVTHVIILDGTMSSLDAGDESNAGLTYKLLKERAGADLWLYYEAGIQMQDWRHFWDVVMGRGLNRQIRRAYGALSSKYRAGDRIYLFGYSRGAYAVRVLAGIIDRVGLLTPEHALERNVQTVWRHYERDPHGPAARAFAHAHCHAETPIEMIGAWDTVAAKGLHVPVLWRYRMFDGSFRTHHLSRAVKHACHALALDETRAIYAPVLWETDPDDTRVEQVWFRGAHGDVGGHLGGFRVARPLSNIPLNWMLSRAEAYGLPLPAGWRARFGEDATAQSVGTMFQWGMLFTMRAPREVGRDPSERVHESVQRLDIDLPVVGTALPQPAEVEAGDADGEPPARTA